METTSEPTAARARPPPSPRAPEHGGPESSGKVGRAPESSWELPGRLGPLRKRQGELSLIHI
eukprot:11092075-Alexandrium_andersonii.AAC.1